jgi:transcriptional regulator with XRE-family HTH domain
MIGQKIYYYRKTKGLTQEQLSDAICSISYLSKIENGHENPSLDILSHLCNRLDISVDDLQENSNSDSFITLLNKWYRFILDRNLKGATEVRAELEKNVKGIEDPNLLLKFNLYDLRYNLFRGELDKAGKIIDRIHLVKDRQSNEINYYYYLFIGLYEYLRENYVDAAMHYKKAETIGDTIGLSDSELYYQLALVNAQLYHMSNSISYAHRALDLFDKECNYLRSIDCHILLGINYRRTNNYDQAESCFFNALKVAESINNTKLKGIIYHNLGYLYSTRNDHKKALEYYQLSVENKTESQPVRLVRTYHLIAKEYINMQLIQDAFVWVEKGLEVADTHNIIEFQYHFKVLKCQSAPTTDFIKMLKDKAIPFFEKKHSWIYVAEYSELLGEYYSAKSQYKNSSHCYRLANEARKKVNL